MHNKYKHTVYFGIVEDNNDPRKQGRLKIRVQNVFDGLPLSHLPWSSPYIVSNGKSFNVPAVGKIVNVTFDKGSIYSPYYIYTEKYNINLQDKLESISDDDYDNFNALLFDHRTQIFSETDKLTLDFKLNKLTIDNESMNMELKDNAQLLNLGSRNADQPVILGKNFMDWFYKFVKAMINPANMQTSAGPVVKPNIDILLNEFMMNRGTFVSTNVFVPDNSGIDTLERDTITSEVEHDDLGIVSPNEDFGVPNSSNANTNGSGASNTQSNSQGKGTASSKKINTSTDVNELDNDKKNVEESSAVSKESKDKIKEKQEKEKKDVEDSKPKLIIRIPIPYTDKYITIKLASLFLVLGGAALAFLAFKLLSNLSSDMPSGFPIQENDFGVDESDIKNELDNVDLDEIESGLKNGGIGVSSITVDEDGLDVDGSSVGTGTSGQGDKYIKNKKSNKYKKSPFSFLNRGRSDLLDSGNVKGRNPDDKKNKNNNNYGSYY